MIVIDASVAVKWFLREDGRDRAMKVFNLPEGLAAPDLVVLEVGNVLRRKCRMGMVIERQLHDAGATVARCFGALIALSDLIEEAMRVSIQLNHSIYDCACLACARMLDTRLLTANDHFLNKVRRHGALSPHATSLFTF